MAGYDARLRGPWTDRALICTHVSITAGYLLVDTERNGEKIQNRLARR